jgi:Gas vesicle synthesis protein GvpL/GvpF
VNLLLHAITVPPEVNRPVRGLQGSPLGTLLVDGLTAWTSLLATTTEPFTRADLLENHRVVSDVFTSVDACLPARFPTLLTDEASALDLLRRRRADLLARLKLVHGCCELAVTAVWTGRQDAALPALGASSPGQRYLLERQHAIAGSDRRRAHAAALATALIDAAGDDLMDSQARLCPSPIVALSAALLVKRANVEGVRSRLPHIEQGVRILVNGPWPPYTFAVVGSP